MVAKRKKKLVAIMFTELTGYNKQANEDEKHALQLLSEHDKILDDVIVDHSGRVVKHMNEKVFAEFTSATEAIQCAIEIQKALKRENELNPETFKMEVKIGVHMGEVYEKDNDLFGDGVNMAARIEPIATPGEIVTSQAVYNSIRSEKDIFTRDMGRVLLKNIVDPERVFKVYLNEVDYKSETPDDLVQSLISRNVNLADRKTSKEKVKSVAVLYLNNLGSADDEFFCYGLTEDLIVDLSKAGKIRVPMTAEVMKFKNEVDNGSFVAEKLNVEHVVEGSIMRIGEMLRLSLQLVDFKNNTIWSERWEGSTKDLQTIRSKVIAKVLDSLGFELSDSFKKLLKKDRQVSPEAYELFLKGRYLLQSAKSKMDMEITQSLLKEAIKIDDKFIEVRVYLAGVLQQDNEFEKAIKLLDETMILAKSENDLSNIAGLHNVYGLIYKTWGKYDQAIDSFEAALSERAKENNLQEEARILNNLGQCYANIGNAEISLEYLNRSLEIKRELDDKKGIASSVANMSIAYRRKCDYSTAIDLCNESIELLEEFQMQRNCAIMKMNLAHNLVYIGHYEDAMNNYKSALKVLTELNDYGSSGLIYRHQGIIYLSQEKWKQAQKSFTTALKLHHKAEHRPAVEATTLFLGQSYLYANDLENAEKYILRALKLTTRRKDSLYDAPARALYFLLQAKQNKIDENKLNDFVKEIEKFIKENQQIAREAWYISQIFLTLDNEEKALHFQKVAQKLLKEISKSISDDKIREDYINLPLIHKKMFEPLKQYEPPVQDAEEIKKVRKEETPSVFAFCPSCGTPNKNKFKFCPGCGNSLVNS